MNKLKKIKEKIDSLGDPLTNIKSMMQDKKRKFSISEVSEETVIQTARKMKNSTSLGPDTIQADLLKKTLPWTSKIITSIINQSLRDSQFPERWKVAKVVPLYKKDCPLEPSNRKHHSTISALIETYEETFKAQKENELSASVLLDQ